MGYQEGNKIYVGAGLIGQVTTVATTNGGGTAYVLNAANVSDGMWVTIEVTGKWTLGLHGGACLCLVALCVDDLSQVDGKSSSWNLDYQIDVGEGGDEWIKAALKVGKVYQAACVLNMIYSGAHYAAPDEFREACLALAKQIDGAVEVIPIPGGGKGLGVSAGAVYYKLHTGTKLDLYPPVLRYSPQGTLHVNNCASSSPLYVSLQEWDWGILSDGLDPIGFRGVSHYSDNYRFKWYPKERGGETGSNTVSGVLSGTNRGSAMLSGRTCYTKNWLYGGTAQEAIGKETDQFLELLPTYWKSDKHSTYAEERAFQPDDDDIHLVGVRIPCDKSDKPKVGTRPYEVEPFGAWSPQAGEFFQEELRLWRNGAYVYGLFDGGAGEIRGEMERTLTEGTDEYVKVSFHWYRSDLRFGKGYFEIKQKDCQAKGTTIAKGKWSFGDADPDSGKSWSAKIKSRELRVLPVSECMVEDDNEEYRSFAGQRTVIGKDRNKFRWKLREPDVQKSVLTSGDRLTLNHDATAGTVSGNIEWQFYHDTVPSVELTAERCSPQAMQFLERSWSDQPSFFVHNEVTLKWAILESFRAYLRERIAREQDMVDRSVGYARILAQDRLEDFTAMLRAHSGPQRGEATLLNVGGPLILQWLPDGITECRCVYES